MVELVARVKRVLRGNVTMGDGDLAIGQCFTRETLAVNAQRDGPAHPHVLEEIRAANPFRRLNAEVQVLPLAAGRGNQLYGASIGGLQQWRDVPTLDHVLGDKVTFVRQEQIERLPQVGDEAEDDAVEVGQPLGGAKVVRVAHQRDVVALHPLFDDEGSPAQRLTVRDLGAEQLVGVGHPPHVPGQWVVEIQEVEGGAIARHTSPDDSALVHDVVTAGAIPE